MADKRNLDSCTIVEMSSQSEKGKDYTKRKIINKGKKKERKYFLIGF